MIRLINIVAIALFIMTIIILFKFNLVCEVTIDGEAVGYIADKDEFETKINEIISFLKRQKRQRSSVWKHCRLRKIINPNRFLRLYFSPFSGMLYKPLITLNFMLQRQGALFGFVILRGIIPRSYIFLYQRSLLSVFALIAAIILLSFNIYCSLISSLLFSIFR